MERRVRSMPFFFILLLASAAAHAQSAPGASLAFLADSSSGLGAEARVTARGDGEEAVFLAAFLLPGDWKPLAGGFDFPEGRLRAGASLAAPGLLAGTAAPSGLAFLDRPCSAECPTPGRAPFAQARPLEARWNAIQVGSGWGAFAAAGASENTEGRTLAGLWAAPAGTAVSAYLAAGREPAEAGGPSWFEPPAAERLRAWGSVSAALGSGPWSLGTCLGGSLGYPGPDAWAARADAAYRRKPLALSLSASFASAYWLGLDGAPSPGCRLAADASWLAGPWSFALGLRSVAAWDGLPPEGGADCALELVVPAFRAGLRAELSGSGEGPVGTALRASLSPGFAHWLALEARCSLEGGEADRAAVGLEADADGPVGLAARLTAGRDGDGGYLSASAAVTASGSGWSARAGLGTRGEWRPGRGSPGELELSCSLRLELF